MKPSRVLRMMNTVFVISFVRYSILHRIQLTKYVISITSATCYHEQILFINLFLYLVKLIISDCNLVERSECLD